MNTILSSTSRGQITLPKDWRDKFDTRFYEVVIDDDKIVIRPLEKRKDFEYQLEDSWQEYKNGDFISHEEMVKKYGL